MDQELFTKVTGVTRKYEDIEKDFKEAYGEEAEEKLKARVKAWVGEGKVFDFEINEIYPLSKVQEVLNAAGVGYNLSEADVETGSDDSSDDNQNTPTTPTTPTEGSGDNTGSYDDTEPEGSVDTSDNS